MSRVLYFFAGALLGALGVILGAVALARRAYLRMALDGGRGARAGSSGQPL